MTMVSPDDGRPSISRTARYKKVTKPLLERKRRARINRCLDELKDLMVGAFEVEGDNISKLEKADILELTVRHLTKLHSPSDPAADDMRFQAGFGQCATEACQFILSMPGVDTQIGQNLIKHLHKQISDVNVPAPSKSSFSPPVSPGARSTVSDARSNVSEWTRSSVEPRQNLVIPDPRMIHVKQELPHVPVNQSLMCDTASMNSAPSVYDLSKPMTGLLMTVDNNQANSSYGYSNYNPYSGDVKKKLEAEEKKKIMKKIRDQILGRQIKDVEPSKSTVSSTSQEQHLDKYNNYEMRYRNGYNQEEQRPSSTVDVRKRSKGESKHYSPYYESRHQRREESNSSQYALNYSVTDRKNTDDIDSVNYQKNDAESYSVKKRHADYRNIHPKKVLIRPMMEEKDKEQSNAASTSNEPINYSSLRHQRPMSAGRHHENQTQHSSGSASQQNYSNAYNRYLSSNEYRRMMERAAQNMNNDDSDDNMWRPW